MRIEVEAIHGEAPLHNLIASSVELPLPTGEDADRWQNGYTWYQEGCVQALSFRQLCDTETDMSETPVNAGNATSDPMTYFLPFECYTTGPLQEGQEVAVRRRLEVAAVKAFETEFWAGLVADTPNTTGSSDTGASGIINQLPTTDPTPVDPLVALLGLTQALANCGAGAVGMIHAVPYLAETWAARNYLSEDTQGRLRTRARGDIVVVGSGYTGDGPTGNPLADPADGTVWAYATPIVGYRRSEVRFTTTDPSEIVDRATNVVRWVAEQDIGYQVDVDCCRYAVLVDVP